MRRRPLIAIVGRPNVGKSTLFNRLIGERRAVVHDLPGMTRDRHYADGDYRMRPFTVIDTGGYEDNTESHILQQMRQQSIIAIEEADVVIFLTDVKEPNDPVDLEILERLRTSGRPFFLAINKCEGPTREAQAYCDFSVYGLDEIFPLSALHGEGVFDLMDQVTDTFERWDPDEEEYDDSILRIAIVGRQNVGKSTLLNRLLGEERVIANPMAGTTRDAIDAPVKVNGKDYLIIDTAGIRRRGKIERGPEKLSVHSSFRAIDRSHVVLLLIDINEGITAQDTHIAGYVLDRKKACILLLNKWDQVEEREKAFGENIRKVREDFNFIPWAPIMMISALTGQRTHRIWDLINHCAENYRRKFSTRELNLILQKATTYLSPPTHKGNALKVKYVTQTRTSPPTLTLFVNDPKFVHFSYMRFLKNQFYQQLGLEGTPLIIYYKRKSPPKGWDRAVREAELKGKRKMRNLDLEENELFIAGVYQDQGEEYVVDIDLSDQVFEIDIDDVDPDGDDHDGGED